MTGTEQGSPVATILGDRLCVKCAYNLRGQPVVREPHYGLILARCPECNTPAALQEYPLLGRWPGRIRVFVALAYAAAVVLAVAIALGMLGGFAAGIAGEGRQGAAQAIAEQWAAHVNAEEAEANSIVKSLPLYAQLYRDDTGRVLAYIWNPVDPEWWRTQDDRPAWATLLWPIVLENTRHLFAAAVVFFVYASAWAVLLLGARRPVMLGAWLVPLTIVLGFQVLEHLVDVSAAVNHNADSLARAEAMPAATTVVALVWTVFGGFGVWFGRPLARLGVRALLPPTLRGALAELWFTDGVALPTNTRAPRRLHTEAAPRGGGPGDAAHEHVRRPH